MARASIVIPTHNNADTLPRTLRTALDQDIGDFEVIVVNDAGEDPRAFLDLSPDDAARVTIIDKDRNAGVSAARNDGLAASTGAFVLFLDSDDLICPDFLRLGCDMLARHPGAGVCFGDSRTVPIEEAADTLESLSRDRGEPDVVFHDSPAFMDLLRTRTGMFKTSCTIYTRACLDSVVEEKLWREDLRNNQDTHLLLRVALRHGCVFMNSTMGVYVRREGSLSTNQTQAWKRRVLAMDMLLTEYPELGAGDAFRPAIRAMRNNGARRVARLLHREGDRAGCLAALREDLRRSPNYKSLLYYLRFRLVP